MEDNSQQINNVFANFRRIGIAYRNAASRQLNDMHITHEQCALLYLIEQSDMTQKEIAQKLKISEATLSGRVKRLEKMHYIERVQDQNDKRKYDLFITPSGKKALDEAKSIVDRLSKQCFEGFDDQDFALLMSLFQRVYKNLEKMKGENACSD